MSVFEEGELTWNKALLIKKKKHNTKTSTNKIDQERQDLCGLPPQRNPDLIKPCVYIMFAYHVVKVLSNELLNMSTINYKVWKVPLEKECTPPTGVEFRRRWRWVMSGVLAEETLQRSAECWCGWWEQAVSGLAEAEREQWWESK